MEETFFTLAVKVLEEKIDSGYILFNQKRQGRSKITCYCARKEVAGGWDFVKLTETQGKKTYEYEHLFPGSLTGQDINRLLWLAFYPTDSTEHLYGVHLLEERPDE